MGLKEINSAVNATDQVVQQNATMVDNLRLTAEMLAQESTRLGALVGIFKLGESQGAENLAA